MIQGLVKQSPLRPIPISILIHPLLLIQTPTVQSLPKDDDREEAWINLLSAKNLGVIKSLPDQSTLPDIS